MKPPTTIRVSEIFHSVQGEGNTMGLPSVFLRLTACNLMCGGQGTEKDKALHNGATWRCDTIEVWRSGVDWDIQELANHIKDTYGKELTRGSQLVITGGEPLLQEPAYSKLIILLKNAINPVLRIEVETNGTIEPMYSDLVTQYNVSPKLANSGMPANRRIKPDAMEAYASLGNGWDGERKAIFKFVITDPHDLSEVMKDFALPFEISDENIYLMPGCSDREQFEKVAPVVAEACKKYGFKFSSRLQINLWNEVTGV